MEKDMNGLSQTFRRIRNELDVTQNEMAHILGLSEKAVQSYEQGWRQPPESVQRLLNVVYVAHRMRKRGDTITCWEVKDCLPSVRRNCTAYQTRQGHLCWLLTGTQCAGQDLHTCHAKNQACHKCKVYRRLGISNSH